jgi:hypothetical protein
MLGLPVCWMAERLGPSLLSIALASSPLCLLASDMPAANELRVARAGQNCADCFELPPCDIPTPQPCEPCPIPPQPGEPAPGEVTTPDQPADEAPIDQQPDNLFDDAPDAASSMLPSGAGAVAASDSPDVHMIGDFFSTGYFLGGGISGTDGFATVPSAGGDRRFKATDNLCPLPQDRVFFNYHHFHNATYDVNGVNQDVNRYTFGLERTYLDETISFEVRMPITGALDSGQVEGAEDTLTSELGNLALTVKAFLWQWRSLKFAAGMATTLPTADDGSVQGDFQYTELRNEAVHIQPYLGVHCSRPGRRLFSTTYVGVDVDVNGNEILTDQTGNGPGIISLGEIEDPALLFCDAQIGYWWYQDYGHIGYLNGIAPVVEIHYSQILESPENIDGFYENPFGQASLLNLTMGFVFDFRREHQLAVYSAVPLKHPEANINGLIVSPVFDAEVGAQWVYKY